MNLITGKKKDEDILIDYYQGNIDRFPAELAEKERRYDYILMLMLDHRTDRYIVEMLKSKMGIKKTQAYIDIMNCKYIHGSIKKLDKGFELYKQQQDIEKAIRLAQDTGNQPMLIKALELRDKLIAKIEDDTDLPLDKMGNKNFFMIFQMGEDKALKIDFKNIHKEDPEEMRKLLKELNDQAIDASYEVIASELKKDLDGK